MIRTDAFFFNYNKENRKNYLFSNYFFKNYIRKYTSGVLLFSLLWSLHVIRAGVTRLSQS